ncbi:hypothetical protein ABBQ32_008833 [Trebouxia sp. C0010 RCD-2024]
MHHATASATCRRVFLCWVILKLACTAAAGSHNVDRPKQRKLDIVLSHYWASNSQQVTEIWKQVSSLPTIEESKPYFFMYCKSIKVPDEDFDWFHEHGEVQHLDNVGRESHTFVLHMLLNLDDLADHTLFHQAIPDNVHLLMQRLGLFGPSTGLLALGYMGKCTCTTCWLHHIPKVREIWAMARQSFCAPDEDHAVFMRGAFLVSSHRIRSVPVQVYKTLLKYSGSPNGHWVHTEHSEDWARSSSNPLSAHVLERTWNVLFDCLDPDIVDVCERCTDEDSCLPSACQCSDTNTDSD